MTFKFSFNILMLPSDSFLIYVVFHVKFDVFINLFPFRVHFFFAALRIFLLFTDFQDINFAVLDWIFSIFTFFRGFFGVLRSVYSLPFLVNIKIVTSNYENIFPWFLQTFCWPSLSSLSWIPIICIYLTIFIVSYITDAWLFFGNYSMFYLSNFYYISLCSFRFNLQC